MEPREDEFGYYERSADGRRTLFRDRHEAGARLAAALSSYRGRHPLVLGIPRGGIPVAFEVAQHLCGELDVIVARKIASPGQPELAMGAVASDGTLCVNSRMRSLAGVSEDVFARLAEAEQEQARQREDQLRAGLAALDPAGRVVVVVDDGLATGATMRAAVRSLKRRGAEHVVVAAPVGAAETCSSLEREVDALICPHRPDPFYAVGLHYRAFDQTSDEEVERLLRAHRATPPNTPRSSHRAEPRS